MKQFLIRNQKEIFHILTWMVAVIIASNIHFRFTLIPGIDGDIIVLNIFLLMVWTIVIYVVGFLVFEWITKRWKQ